MVIWNKIRKNELVCLIAMLAALMYGMYYMDIMNPLQYSLSEIGRHNNALFILWAVLSGLALFFNVNRAYDRLKYKSKLGSALLYTGLGFLVLTFLNMSREPVFYWIHVSTAILFSVLCFGSIVMPLLYMFKKDRKYRIMAVIFFSLVFVDIVFLAVFKQMALYEFIPLILGYIVLFFINYTETFNVLPKS
jgi:hypothetical protein